MPPRVLVVEDDRFVRALISYRLSEAGFDVDQAGSSDAAVRLLEADDYQLMVATMHVPGKLDGVDLAVRAQVEGAMPVVFMTASPCAVDRLRANGVPGEALRTPFALDELVGIVRRLTSGG
jgi:DNA-binding response OmpR family regulator